MFEHFVMKTASTREWGQACCLFALSNIFKVTIKVWDDRLPCEVSSIGEGQNMVNIVFMAGANHYEGLVPAVQLIDITQGEWFFLPLLF